MIINILYSGRPNNERDTYLKGLTERYDVTCHRILSNKSKQNTSSYKYFAMNLNSKVEECQKAYMSLHSIDSSKIVERLIRLVARKLEPMDNRGKHTNRGNVLDPLVLNKISDLIASFPTKALYYTAHPIIYQLT